MPAPTIRIPRAIAVTGLACLVAYLTAMLAFPKPSGRIIIGDAVHHFVQLRSLVFDHDLQFRNEYVEIYDLQGGEPGTEWVFTDLTPTGHVRNYMPIGPALLWAPLYLLVAGVEFVRSWLGLGPPPTGYDLAARLVPGVTGILAATIAAWLCWRLARRYVAEPAATLGVLGTWIGTQAIYYTLVSPAYSHAASMLAVSWFFWRWLSTRDDPTTRHVVEWGALAGVAALMRWQDAILLAVPAIELLRAPIPWSRRIGAGAAAVGAWLVVFSPQMAVWTILYGQPFALPQGPSFMQWTSPHPLAVLFSDNHGLFTWAPLLVCAAMGLVAWLRREPGPAPAVIVVLLVSWYVNAAVADWWAGEAFGARRFLSLFPLFALGMAVWLGGGRTAGAGARGSLAPGRLAVTGALVVANWLLLLQYQLFMRGLVDLAPYPHGVVDLWLTRFVVPIRLIASWLS